jgi:prevent-host-death family protein
MQVNMLEAKSQLSKLVKAAIAGEEVVIASHGKAQVKLVPLMAESGLHQPGSLRGAMPNPDACDAAFSDSVEAEVSALMNG